MLFGVDTDCGLKNPMDICLLGTCQWLTAAINVVQPPIRKYLQDYFKVSYLIIKFTPIIPDWRKYRYHSNIRKFCQFRSIQGSSQSSSCVVPHEPLKVQETQLSILVCVVHQKNCLGMNMINVISFSAQAESQRLPLLNLGLEEVPDTIWVRC